MPLARVQVRPYSALLTDFTLEGVIGGADENVL
jgi:hypothetical protein